MADLFPIDFDLAGEIAAEKAMDEWGRDFRAELARRGRGGDQSHPLGDCFASVAEGG
jgi:hypothetical protein